MTSSAMSDHRHVPGVASDPVPEVTPFTSYNFRKAKLNSSVAWLLSKAYSDREDPPLELLDPLYQDNEGEDHVKPSVIYQLASGELYSRVCSSIFPPSIHPWEGHAAILQGLSTRGIYVLDDRNQPVTESILSQTQKIKLNGHVAMMDAIMRAYVTETVSIEKVVQAVRQFTTFNASSDLPFDLEDSLLFWVNRVCLAVKHRLERDRKTHQANLIQSATPAIRVKRDQVQVKSLPHIPQMKDIMKDISDGCCLATVIHHYYPHLLSLDDLTLEESMSFANSLHNLQVVTAFFQHNLPHVLHFTLEDLLYCHDSMKPNILALLSEMFYCFEVERPQHLEANQGGFQSSAFTPSPMAAKPPIPISVATKRSFHAPAQSPKTEQQSVDLTNVPSSPNAQRRLLNRQQQERSSIFGEGPGDEYPSPLQRPPSWEQKAPGSQSILAWEERDQKRQENRTPNTATFSRPRRLQDSPTINMQSSRAGSLLANVSIDSEMNESQDLSGLDIEVNPLPERIDTPSSQGSIQQQGQERLMMINQQRPVSREGQMESEDLEVESLTSAASSRMSQHHAMEKESFNPMLTHRTDPVVNGMNGSQNSLSGQRTFRAGQKDQLDDMMSPGSETGSVDSTKSRKNLKLDVHPLDILGSPRGPTNEFMPAVLRPLKEKTHQNRKMEERGEHLRHRNKHRAVDHRMATAHPHHSQDQGSDSSESVDATTPLSGESIADSLAGDLALQRARMARGGAGGFMLAPMSQGDQPQLARGRHGDAFFISGSGEAPLDGSHHSSSAPTGAKSFTIEDREMTMDDARQAGIPVVSASRSMQGLSEQRFHIAPGGMTTSVSDQEIYQPHPQHSQSFQNPVSSAAAPSSLPYSMHASDPYSNPHHPNQYDPQFNPHQSNPHHANPHSANPHSNPLGNPHHDVRTQHHAQPQPYSQQADAESYIRDQQRVSTWGHHQQQQQQQQQQQYHSLSGTMTNPGMSQPFTNPNTNPTHSVIHEKESPKLMAEEVQSERQDKRPMALNYSHNLSPVHQENGVVPRGERNTPAILSHSGVLLTHDNIVPNSVHPNPIGSPRSDVVRPFVHGVANIEPQSTVDRSNSHSNQHSFAADVQSFHSNQSAFREPSNQSLTTWSAKSKLSNNTDFPTTPTSSITHTNTGAAGNGFHYGSRDAAKSGDGSVPNSELTHIRLRLEEKRRLMDYEKRKLERQWSKQRQRVGKAAFLQVLANKKQDKEANGEDHLRAERQRNFENAQWQGEDRPPQGLTTFAALSANRDKPPQGQMSEQQQQQQHTIQQNQLTQAYFMAQQNQMTQQHQLAQRQVTKSPMPQPINQPMQAEERVQQHSPQSHVGQAQLAEGVRRSNESPRSGRDSDSPRMRSDSPQVPSDVPRRTESPGSSSGSHSPHLTQDEYNVSLEKLNANLSQLQNQIMRLSLQQDEMKKGIHDSPRQVQDSPRHVQESPRQMGQGDFTDSAEPREAQRPPSRPLQDTSGQMTGFYMDVGDQRPDSRVDQDPYVLEENPAFIQGQPTSSPREMQHIRQSPQRNMGTPSETNDNFNEKQTNNAHRLSDVTYITSEMNDNKYIMPDNVEHVGVEDDRTFSGQDTNYENENQRQLKSSVNQDEEEEQSPPANQRKAQPVLAFNIDMSEPKHPRTPPANQRKKEPTPKKAPQKKESPPRTPVKKQAPPSVYEIVGEGEEDVPIEETDMIVRPLEPADVSKNEDADGSGLAAGFIIGEDTQGQDEMAKRKELFLKARLKREEEAKIKRAAREAEAERKREELRKKQEDAEMKKAEQAARREQIRLEYQRKKQAELDPDSAPPPQPKKKSSRPRPKSQMITSDRGPTHSHAHSHGHTAMDGASAVALSVQKRSYTIQSTEGELLGAEASGVSENQTSAPAPTGDTPQQSAAAAASAPPPSSTTAPSQAADQSGGKKSPSASRSIPMAVKRRPPSPRPRANTIPGSIVSPDKYQAPPQIQPQAAAAAAASTLSPQEGAVGFASPSVASQESSGSGGSLPPADYSGPKLFVKPTSKSNRHIIINSISHCVLAGIVNEKTKDKVLQEIAKSDQKHFMIMFRDHSLQFRSLYAFSPESEELTKVYGTGPRHITNKMTEALYKYNSGGKQFIRVPSKSMSVQIDGVTINSAFWQPKRPATTKKH